ncbi:hypothetical protein JB92DRAFT_2976339, partial [Gautieria morchelliformis]
YGHLSTRRNHIQRLGPRLNCSRDVSSDRHRRCTQRAQPETLHSSNISGFFSDIKPSSIDAFASPDAANISSVFPPATCNDILQFLKDLTEENAALPHGGPQDRVLGKLDLVLFDITGTLHGYYSDNTQHHDLAGGTWIFRLL